MYLVQAEGFYSNGRGTCTSSKRKAFHPMDEMRTTVWIHRPALLTSSMLHLPFPNLPTSLISPPPGLGLVAQTLAMLRVALWLGK
ncbi:hypothetical protein PGT21_005429 [Puccinia graminis f. sp. tritici]|uniref:Uncharacterized protein n=1 Tax=Puccinia graminis f. sp. tritici TaxID=56615 RepID=A0A5B0QSH4_PUCGR|nr:hypothetical protein PGT21_005429 [Puccinia graminis f. sp. tritici]